MCAWNWTQLLNGAKRFFNLKNYVKVRKKLEIKKNWAQNPTPTNKTPNKFYYVKTKTKDSLQKEEQFNVKTKTKGSLNKEEWHNTGWNIDNWNQLIHTTIILCAGFVIDPMSQKPLSSS
jgi:hypothetical protein